MIVSIATRFKRRKVSTLIDFYVMVSILEVIMMAFTLPQFPTLLIGAIVVKPFTWVIPHRVEFKNDFINLALGRATKSNVQYSVLVSTI